MSFIAVGGTLAIGGTVGAGTIAAGAGLLGTGLNLIGSNQQNKANQAAQQSNQAAQQKQNDASWTNWLMTKGLAPTPGTTFTSGVMPTAGQYQVTNTRLPLWANINLPPTSGPGSSAMAGPLTVRRKGAT